MATPNPTDRRKTKKPSPPAAGTRPSFRVDDQLADDLATIMRTGVNVSDAVRLAVRQLAAQYRTAWANNVCPPGRPPVVLAYQMDDPQTAARLATSRYDALSDARRTPHGTDQRLPAAPVGRTYRLTPQRPAWPTGGACPSDTTG